MFTISVELAANLRLTRGKREFELEIDEGTTVASFLELLDYGEESKFIVVVINGTLAHKNDIIPDNSVLFLSIPAGGG